MLWRLGRGKKEKPQDFALRYIARNIEGEICGRGNDYEENRIGDGRDFGVWGGLRGAGGDAGAGG
jgi:hypothetical protein